MNHEHGRTYLYEVGGLVGDAHAGGADGDADADEGREPLDAEEDVGRGIMVQGDHHKGRVGAGDEEVDAHVVQHLVWMRVFAVGFER